MPLPQPPPCRSILLLGQALILAVGTVPACPQRTSATPAGRGAGKALTVEAHSSAGESPRHGAPASGSASPDAGQATRERAREAYGGLPMSFEPNVGQADSSVRFLSHGAGYSLFLSPTGAAFYLSVSSDRKSTRLNSSHNR
jgi:hypothetical protein